MRFLINILIGLFFILTLYCCKDKPQQSVDFTNEFAFTAGIEGPAVNQNGDLFAVNFAKEGTIGKVNKDGEVKRFQTTKHRSKICAVDYFTKKGAKIVDG